MDFFTGNGSIIYAVCSKNRKICLKQHIKYFNFRSKIQLDHPLIYLPSVFFRNRKDDREGRTRVSDARRSERRRTEEKSRSRVDKRESERDRHSNSKSKSKTRDEEKESNARHEIQ